MWPMETRSGKVRLVAEGATELVGEQHGSLIVGGNVPAGDAELRGGLGDDIAATEAGNEVGDEVRGRISGG